MEWNESLQAAYAAVQKGDVAETAEVVNALKALPRTDAGIFDLSGMNGDVWEDAGLVYPVYVAYETVCNKKEGYPDLIRQMRAWDEMLAENFTFEHAAAAASMWVHTLQYMSPEIYEYYRELQDIFKNNVKKTLDVFYAPDAPGKDAASAELFKAAVLQACEADYILAEKYEKRV